MLRLRQGLALIMFISVGFFLWLAQVDDDVEGTASSAHKGFQAPNIQLERFDGRSFVLEEVFANGRPALLYFWTSWCPYCERSTEHVQRIDETYGENIEVIGVNVANQDVLTDAEVFIKKHETTFTQLLDKEGEVSSVYQTPPIPLTVWIDEQGAISERRTGAVTYSELEANVIELLEKGD
ncbi:TlpA family protein disulfide reductase [Texcoconibacillus texcoconensis]|uniref:Thiol-disulfide isomerase/thioredoxin n=1 Tax=Texcoconibacillus texcoconensis TaxID=1095777 RepID=A0A840QT29_9BACI|nr:TlpA disulfide reductase family protein [Texcoconibacillus texcoconensis]MBB5174441.1 thiol-disulfide isomerase/thioredoxin [Texcoconibacillus texcoconensis]